jgi:predicted lipoprotein with Yx(FWY)xxD motif
VRDDDSEFGSILFDSDQQAIYLFDKETSDTSECYGDCAAAWPPVLTDGDPQVEEFGGLWLVVRPSGDAVQ